MDLEKIALNIVRDENGIYNSKSDSSISYPEVGNENCMQIEEHSFWFKHRNNIIAESVKKHNAQRVFFDIGGGNGFVSKRLQDEGIEVLLVEPGPTGAMNAHKRGIENVLCSTLEDAAFTAKSIDSVGLFDVVEHIEDDYAFLTSINKFMKDDGLIYITVPAHKLLWSSHDEYSGHFRRYSKAKLNDLLKKSGFDIVYSTYIFTVVPIPLFLVKSLPNKLGLNKGEKKLKQLQNEHKVKKGLMSNLMQKFLNWELSRIKRNKPIFFGGSCFVIGKKVTNIN